MEKIKKILNYYSDIDYLIYIVYIIFISVYFAQLCTYIVLHLDFTFT